MKTAAIISCNDNYDYDTRTKYVYDFLHKKGYKVTFFVADFDHRNKKIYKANRLDKLEYIHVRPYEKNISIRRILSHFDFARGVKRQLLNHNFDLVYHCAPPNSTIRVLSIIKRKKKFKLITEIGDMWPETMPVSKSIKKVLVVPLGIWKAFRDKYLFNSDIVIAECDLFKKQLEKNTGLGQIQTLYFCKAENFVNKYDTWCQNTRIELCYLGSINNIIDIEMIGRFIKELGTDRQVIVHVIGDGEKRKELLDSIKNNGGEPIFHGIIFSESDKKEIFAKCDYCLNIMKTTVNVGMTMKSLDYFSFGIPIINNIRGDISKLVQDENIGFNIEESNIKEVVMKIKKMSFESYLRMVKNVQDIHNKNFCIEKFNYEMEKML